MTCKIVLFFVLITTYSCQQKPEDTVILFDNPGSLLGSEPSLHKADNGIIYLTWIEAKEEQISKLLFSTLNEADLTWSSPTLIAEGSDWFVNWADFPSMISFGEGSLVTHYLDKSDDGTYAYDIKLALSNDNGKTWYKTIVPHKDSTQTEHGFVSKTALKNDSFLSVWLDGRQYAYAEKDSTVTKEMTLRSAVINSSGHISEETLLDSRVCDCCQTDTAMTNNGPIVVYRDRSDKEIRDIYYVRHVNGNWSTPKPLHNDHWMIAGCPVNGPAIATKENTVAVAWFTMANNIPNVKVAFSNNNGKTFALPILLDQTKASGRVDIELLNDHTALVSWLDTSNEKAIIRVQRVAITGEKSQLETISESSESRSSGFPRMIVKDNTGYITWTNTGDTLTVRTSLIDSNKLVFKP